MNKICVDVNMYLIVSSIYTVVFAYVLGNRYSRTWFLQYLQNTNSFEHYIYAS